MIKAKVTLLREVFGEVKKALQWNGVERACYLLSHSSTYGESLKLMPYKVIIPEEKDYVRRSPGYYELSKPFINRVFNEAIETQSDIIQCHVHPGDPGVFSSIDELEEPIFMRHIAEKIEGVYHGSLVFGNSLNTLDGWFYDREHDQVIPIDKIVIVGQQKLEVHVPYRSWAGDQELSESLSRTVSAFGEKSVRLLGLLDAGVVGTSALGGPVIEFLARDGFKSIFMCDPDVIEVTNLNRLPGVTPKDTGKPKVVLYADYIKRINPEIEVEIFQTSFYEEEVQRAFSQVDLLLGCVDSGARLSMNRLAMANLIPYFDLGAAIEVKKGKPVFFGGQVYSVIPGRECCLACTGVFDNFLQEYNSPADRKANQSQGYINSNGDVVNPLVMFLDYTVSGIGYFQMLKYVCGNDDGKIFNVHYNGTLNKLMQSKCCEAGCINCQRTGFLGQGDKVPFMVPNKNVDSSFPEEAIRKRQNK